jgi:hypothetical protein
MNKQHFDIEYSKLSAKLSSILGGYPIALDAIKKADKGAQLAGAIVDYENLIQNEVKVRQKIGELHSEYINYLDSIIDGVNKRAELLP